MSDPVRALLLGASLSLFVFAYWHRGATEAALLIALFGGTTLAGWAALFLQDRRLGGGAC